MYHNVYRFPDNSLYCPGLDPECSYLRGFDTPAEARKYRNPDSNYAGVAKLKEAAHS